MAEEWDKFKANVDTPQQSDEWSKYSVGKVVDKNIVDKLLGNAYATMGGNLMPQNPIGQALAKYGTFAIPGGFPAVKAYLEDPKTNVRVLGEVGSRGIMNTAAMLSAGNPELALSRVLPTAVTNAKVLAGTMIGGNVGEMAMPDNPNIGSTIGSMVAGGATAARQARNMSVSSSKASVEAMGKMASEGLTNLPLRKQGVLAEHNAKYGSQMGDLNTQLEDVKVQKKMASDISKGLKNEQVQTDMFKKEYQSIIDNKVAKEADTQSIDTRKGLGKLFSNKSKEYMEGLTPLLEGEEIPASSYREAIGKALQESGVLTPDAEGRLSPVQSKLNPTETYMLNEYQKLESADPEAMVGAMDLWKSKQATKPQFGKRWSPEEALSAKVAENMSTLLNEHTDIGAYNKQWSPFLNWKTRASKVFAPHKGEWDLGAGRKGSISDIHQKLIKGENLDPETQRLVGDTEKYLGNQITSRSQDYPKILRDNNARTGILRDSTMKHLNTMEADIRSKLSELKSKKQLDEASINRLFEYAKSKYKTIQLEHKDKPVGKVHISPHLLLHLGRKIFLRI